MEIRLITHTSKEQKRIQHVKAEGRLEATHTRERTRIGRTIQARPRALSKTQVQHRQAEGRMEVYTNKGEKKDWGSLTQKAS